MPRVAALLTLAIGLLDMASAVTPGWRSRLDDLRALLPMAVSRQASAFTVVVGMLLVLLSAGLRRRKRRAWRATVVLLAVSVVLHVLKGLDYEEATGSAALLAALVVTRREFRAKGDPTTRWRAIGVGSFLAVVSIVVGLVLLRLRHDRIVGPHPLSAQLEQVVLGMVGIQGPLTFVSDRFADLVFRILLTMGVLTIVSTGYLALRPPEPRPMLTEEDEARVRALLARRGADDSLGYFVLRSDKSVVWSPSGKACVAYRVVSGVMLASGDPLGDREAWPGALTEFLREAADHAWVPAVIGCSEAGGLAWTRAGLSVLEIGDEAILDTATFSLEGRSMRNVRQAVARVERAGYTAVVQRVNELTPQDLVLLRSQVARWRGSETERGFSMALGRIGDPADGNCVVVTAYSAGAPPADQAPPADPETLGTAAPEDAALPPEEAKPDETAEPRPRAVLHFVPWGRDGLSLDVMTRDRTADNGVNEFLIVQAVRQAQQLGVRRISLNFAVFRSAIERGERLGAGPMIRWWRGLLIFLSRWFQIDSLYRFNAKFQPSWSPRYVCYPTTTDLPRIALAMLEAEAFLVWPRWQEHLPLLRRHRSRRCEG
ncbi:phosphatidylglycerol lysyltransferase domain-containing protein [Parafrankia sp. EUN1f]|uniref:phosphatidylglycerol lysyltransferase domain-containing protein n=1 Tax=Parafrankia sp. EUN1f TaxID=102897 RepID=UPI0006815076|nr:phosphatidylglycerol lysyltransferase domain-containing protein [Parafrankia sp. EUN1f]